jgi:hypothetical protein
VKKLRTQANTTHVPWTLKAEPAGPKGLFKLSDVVVDSYTDPNTKKRYVVMYHGTTSELLNVFKASDIRFDLGKGALGTGFYLTADINEAMYYACERLKERRLTDKTINGMVLVFGVEVNDLLKGKYLPNIPLSSDQTGDPLDPQIHFKRNGKLYNQFAFFSNAKKYIRLLRAIVYQDGFSKSNQINDFDGLPPKPQLYSSPNFTCNLQQAN